MASGDSKPPPAAVQAPERLDGWKEIAAHLRRDPRTVLRWEKSEGLPVHRHKHKTGPSVYAYRSDLDAWWEQRQSKTPRLAILPFETPGQGADGDILRDGFTQELIMELGRVEALEVIAWTTVRSLDTRGKTAKDIGRELNLAYVLQGSLRQDSSGARITSELVKVATQAQVWTATYRPQSLLEDLPEIQREIARQVAGSLSGKPPEEHSTSPAAKRSIDSKAMESYFLGRHYLSSRTSEGFERARGYFQDTADIAPDYAPAYSGLADTYNTMVFYSILTSRDGYPRAREAALRALALDPNSAEAHASLADVLFSHDYNLQAADSEYRQAIELNPSYANAHHWYGLFLVARKKWEPALRELHKAAQLDQRSPIIRSSLALYHYYARDYDRVIEHSHETLLDFRNFPLTYFWLGRAYVEQRRFDLALAALHKGLECDPTSLLLKATLGHAYGVAGQPEEARRYLEELRAATQHRYVSPVLFGMVHMGLGEKDAAVEWAERAYEERAPLLTRIAVDPILDELRSIPRFYTLQQRMNLVTG